MEHLICQVLCLLDRVNSRLLFWAIVGGLLTTVVGTIYVAFNGWWQISSWLACAWSLMMINLTVNDRPWSLIRNEDIRESLLDFGTIGGILIYIATAIMMQ